MKCAQAGKIKHTRKGARRRAAASGIFRYPCEYCHGWHVSGKSQVQFQMETLLRREYLKIKKHLHADSGCQTVPCLAARA